MIPPLNPSPDIRRRARATAGVALGTALMIGCIGLPAMAAENTPGDEQYRPLVHFTPEQNWMNDPNGLVYVDGTYHLFFQHNPQGTTWGNMSWGHATSTDLLHWTQQPLAIPQTFDDQGRPIEDIFSGSIVVDHDNSAGFGPAGSSPMVAIYTSAYTPQHPEHAGVQAQSLAYSLDDGQTWTKYEGNPVLDRGSANFRDPKVFRYDGPAGEYWVMVAVEALEHKVVISKSTDLKNWEHLSDFGPANATGGIWECPDLFPLPVDGDPSNTKWVMVVNLNPGGPNGGSTGQYFVGDFDGTTFTSETTDAAPAAPEGRVFGGFDDGDFDGWTVRNDPSSDVAGPWGAAPATGTIPGQQTVSGWVGAGLVNGFLGGDAPTGTLESPEFTIDDDYIDLLVGGGDHPHVDGAQLSNEPPAGSATLFDFELPEGQNLAESGWALSGDFATDPDRSPSTQGGEGYLGTRRINTFEAGPAGDANRGDMTSPAFTIDGDYVSFLIGGGRRADGSLQAELLVDGQVVRTQTGANSGSLNWASWNVADLRGQQAEIRIHDDADGGWGHLTFDNAVIGDAPAQVRSDETSVNLVVDGRVVRTATGSNSEALSWRSWNVADLRGQQATIVAIDNNRGGWGHLLLDQVTFSSAGVPLPADGYDWLDWGRDYYAGVSYSGTPDPGSRVMQAWMNDWDYAGDIPTSTWRSSMALPREVRLVSTPEGPRLSQSVVPQIDGQLDLSRTQTRTGVEIDGPTALDLEGEVAKIDVVLEPGAAQKAGITVFGDETSGTRIGYDAAEQRVFIDRTASGNVGFNPSFASVDDAPLPRASLAADGSVTLELYIDRASVELFTAGGRVTLTDQVFPNEGATEISAWSEGGAARIRSIAVTPIAPTMWQSTDDGATAPPAKGKLSESKASDGFTVSMTQKKGEDATVFRLYENGTLISTTPLDADAGQRSVDVHLTARAPGTYVYTGELENSRGVTATSSTKVKVK
ncbi:GH32 C-terminal domain-containing protein [Microbacterium natoriense]